MMEGGQGFPGLSDAVDAIVSCNGEQVIPQASGIVCHMEECAAIAEIESGETVENSLFAPPAGKTHVESVVMLYKRDPWRPGGPKDGGGDREKERKDLQEEGKKEGREKCQEEGSSEECREGGKDGAGSLSSCEAMAGALLSLKQSNDISRRIAQEAGKR